MTSSSPTCPRLVARCAMALGLLCIGVVSIMYYTSQGMPPSQATPKTHLLPH